MESGQDRPGRPRAGRPARRSTRSARPGRAPVGRTGRTRGALQGGPLPAPGGPDPQGHVLGRRPCPAPTAMRVRASPAPGGRGRTIGADRARGGSPGRRPPGGRRCHSMTAPAHRVGDLRDRPPAPGPAPMVDPPVWWRISRAYQSPAHGPMIIESNPPRPPLAHGAAGRGVKRAGPHPGAPLVSKGPTSESMVLVVVPPKGACRGPMSSAPPTPWPRVLGRLGPQAAPPEPPRGRAGSSPRAPVITGLSGVDPPGTGRTPAPVSRNRRATSRPSTGLFLSSVALNRRQSFHQGLHRPLNTPDGHCLYVRLRRANGAKPDADQQQDLRTVAAVIIADVPPVAASSPSVHTVHPSPTP